MIVDDYTSTGIGGGYGSSEESRSLANSRFGEMVVDRAFTEEWPNLKRLTFRGISDDCHRGHAMRLLPGVQVDQVLGNFMFHDTHHGTILNHHGADGLKVHLEFGGKYNLDAFYHRQDSDDEK